MSPDESVVITGRCRSDLTINTCCKSGDDILCGGLLCLAVVMVCLLRYAQLIEHSHRCWINTSALVSGCTNALGLLMVGNFQVNIKDLHSHLRHRLLLLSPPFSSFFVVFSSYIRRVETTPLTVTLCLSGGSRQISPLCGCWSGISSGVAVRVPAVCAHLPGGCDCP